MRIAAFASMLALAATAVNAAVLYEPARSLQVMRRTVDAPIADAPAVDTSVAIVAPTGVQRLIEETIALVNSALAAHTRQYVLHDMHNAIIELVQNALIKDIPDALRVKSPEAAIRISMMSPEQRRSAGLVVATALDDTLTEIGKILTELVQSTLNDLKSTLIDLISNGLKLGKPVGDIVKELKSLIYTTLGDVLLPALNKLIDTISDKLLTDLVTLLATNLGDRLPSLKPLLTGLTVTLRPILKPIVTGLLATVKSLLNTLSLGLVGSLVKTDVLDMALQQTISAALPSSPPM